MNNQQLTQALINAPKQFCDNVNGIGSEEAFLVAMSSGQTASVFVLTPAHMKRFSQWAKAQVDEYEKHYGPIKAEWNPNIPSPFVDPKNRPKNDKSDEK